MFEGLFSSDPLGWVNGQHLIDQVLCLRSHCVPLGGRELGEMKEQVGNEDGNKIKKTVGNSLCFPMAALEAASSCC